MAEYVQTGDIDGSYPFRISDVDELDDFLLRLGTTGVLELKSAGGQLIATDALVHTLTVDGGVNALGSSVLFGPTGAALDAQGFVDLPEISATVTTSVTRVQLTADNTGTSTTPTATAFSPATTAGNLLVMVISYLGSGTTITAGPSGYTLASPEVETPAGHGHAAVYYKENCGASAAAPSVTLSNSQAWRVATLEYSGIATSTSLNVQGENTGTSSTTMSTITGLATTQAYELWLVVGRTSSSLTWGAGSNGYTKIADSGSRTIYEKIATSAGDPAMTASLSSTVPWASKLITFKAATSASIAAPSAKKARIYAEDNGSGKTRLMAVFPSGAAQQLAIQP
jgi:hypothetical protein